MDFKGKILKGIADWLVERGLSTANLSTVLSEKDIVSLVSYNFSNWYHLGRSLDIDSSKLDALKVDEHSEINRKLKVFDYWMKRCEDSATYENLVIALFTMNEIADIKCVLTFLSQKLGVTRERQTEMAIDGVYGELDTEATPEASSRSDTSEYQSQPPFPEFVCGCQKCSIKDYLHTGCPLAGKVENYPKLDIKGLPLDD